jgi:predicted nucleic acid-binding protein
MGLIIDSSVLIAAERSKLNWDAFVRKWNSESLFMAAITLSELWQGYHRATGQHLEKRQNFIREMEMSICVLGFGVDEALIHSKIWAQLDATGQKIGPYDMLIAATAVAHELPLATLNQSEFERVPNLKLIPMKSFLIK